MKKAEAQLRLDIENELNKNKENIIFCINESLDYKLVIHEGQITKRVNERFKKLYFGDKQISKLKDYDAAIIKAYELLNEPYKISLFSILDYCKITKDVKVYRILSEEDFNKYSNNGKNFMMVVSRGNLYLKQGSWSQTTETRISTIASDKKIYKDVTATKHIKLIFDLQVPIPILRQLNLNSKKQTPVLETLTGYEPYNLMDLSNEEYIKQRSESDAKALHYAKIYAEHIKLLSNMSPYKAANSFILLQTEINLSIQKCIQRILAQGNVINIDSLLYYSFETIADATRELFIKYHAFDTKPEEKIKITRFIALYFAVVEETQNNVENYIKSLEEKYHLNEEYVYG